MTKGAAVLSCCLAFAARADETDLFVKEVRPVLEGACLPCHGPQKAKGGLRLDQRALILRGGKSGPAAVAGKSAESRLIQRVSLPADHEDVMPAEGKPLTAAQVQSLARWIDAGMAWPAGVELRAPAYNNPERNRPAGNAQSRYNLGRDLPAGSSVQLNRLLAEDNQERPNLPVAPTINDLEFLRKASVDLIGRIPTHAEIQQYLAHPKPQRRPQVVEDLLRHPRFVERWTAFYADMLRIRVDAEGGAEFMNYVRQCLAAGRPYDRMVNDLITASGVSQATPAVGYVLGDNAEPLALAAATAQVFLGIRLGCAQCHDHPFDKWTQQQFYAFAGFFGQTRRVSRKNAQLIYTKDVPDSMRVEWPPEDQALGKPRAAVHPTLPFALEQFEQPPPHLQRFQQRRDQQLAQDRSRAEEEKQARAFEDAIDGDQRNGIVRLAGEELGGDLRAQAEQQIQNQFRTGQIRRKLAEQIAHPRNRFFARAFVNRVWAEVLGRGFYEPVDDYRDSTIVSHPRTLEYLADEFVASAYDLRSLLKLIVATEAYQRGHLPAAVALAERERSEEAFMAGPLRRMPGESLFDSMVAAGHLQDCKWPAGANLKQVVRVVSKTVPVVEQSTMDEEVTADGMPLAATGGYDLESSTPLELETRVKMDTDRLLAELLAAPDVSSKKAGEKAADRPRTRVVYHEVRETIDDNPKFGSAYRIASPAPPPHFLRVFGQPSRQHLGEFRDVAPSMRQELMLLNGQLSDKASSVGPFEPVHALLTAIPPQIEPAIQLVYLEILTREPNPAETAEARQVLKEAPTPLQGMADLRWALINSHPFRYLP